MGRLVQAVSSVSPVLGALIVAVSGFGCYESRDRAPEIVVGVIAGPARIPGVAEGALLAADEINSSGGIAVGGQQRQLRLVVADDDNRPETAVSKAFELINRDGAVAILGLPYSNHAIPVARVAEQRQVPLISTLSTHPETTAGKRYAFRLAFLDSFQGRVLAELAVRDLAARRAAALVDATGVYSVSVAAEFGKVFQELGGELVTVASFTEDELDVDQQLVEIRESDVDVLLMPNNSKVVRRHLYRAEELGLDVTFLGGDTWGVLTREDYSPTVTAYFNDLWAPDSPGELGAGFIDRFRRVYDRWPMTPAAVSYDAVRLLAEVIRRQDRADPEAIRAGLAAIEGFEGVSGTISFFDSGDPQRSAFIRKVSNGEVRYLKEIDPRSLSDLSIDLQAKAGGA